MTRHARTLWIIALLLVVAGCTARGATTSDAPAGRAGLMRDAPADRVLSSPDPTRAMVVFMRPSTEEWSAGIASSVFELRPRADEFIGVVPAGRKIAYTTDPGKTRFMVIGESADFMEAELGAGRTYYVLITPRQGTWKARFWLTPVPAAELGTKEFHEWLNGCTLVENTERSHTWATRHWSSIQTKKRRSLPEWEAKTDRPSLRVSDGR